MELFVGNIHLDTTTNELQELITTLDGQACVLFIEQHRHNGKLRFGRVSQIDEDKARYIIAHLHNKPHRGKKLIVREFRQRATNNERRTDEHESDHTWYGLEKRVAERRALILDEKSI